MTQPEELTPEESFRNGCHYFLEALRVLSLTPVEQCEALGDFNVAWELKSDVLAGRYLVNSGFLSPSERSIFTQVLDALEGIDVSKLPSAAGRAQNLAAMSISAWQPVRDLAARACSDLEPLARQNAAYFRGKHAT